MEGILSSWSKKVSADMKASYNVVFHEAPDKRRQGLSDGQQHPPPMKTVSVAPKLVPAIMPAASSTSVFSLSSMNKKSRGGSLVAKQSCVSSFGGMGTTLVVSCGVWLGLGIDSQKSVAQISG